MGTSATPANSAVDSAAPASGLPPNTAEPKQYATITPK